MTEPQKTYSVNVDRILLLFTLTMVLAVLILVIVG
jgi:hypothetical protein